MKQGTKEFKGNKEQMTRIVLLLLSVLSLFLFAGCRRDMQDQPKMKPLRASTFYRDGLSARQPVEGTVARGYLREDVAFFTGKKSGTSATSGTASSSTNAYPDDVDTFPFTVTEDIVKRGQDRYNIFCVVCHGKTGNGDGMIVRRGFRHAASFNDDRLRQAPVGHFFDAITNGWGAMPAYASQIPVQDRWAIIAYVRALQLSQQRATPNGSPSPSPTPAAAAPSPTTGGHR